MLLTSLEADAQPIAQVIARYRDCWQVEIGFKRLKTLGRLDELPSSDPVLAHLIAEVLTDDLANEIVDFPPRRGEPMPPPQSLWRTWAKAREILLSAILPRPRLQLRAALVRA
jgi:hypothetical protein